MKNKIINFIGYIIAFIIVILFCALAWWFACESFGIPFNWNQFSGIIFIALIFKWINQTKYNDFN